MRAGDVKERSGAGGIPGSRLKIRIFVVCQALAEKAGPGFAVCIRAYMCFAQAGLTRAEGKKTILRRLLRFGLKRERCPIFLEQKKKKGGCGKPFDGGGKEAGSESGEELRHAESA